MSKKKNKINRVELPVSLNGLKAYKLVRERDNLTLTANRLIWVEFDENNKGKAKHDEIAVGRALVFDFCHADLYTWQTTLVTEIVMKTISKKEEVIKFKTKNSTYTLYIENVES